MKTVTFDFDSTLTKKEVQDYAKSLIKKGFDVWIVTSRYDDIHLIKPIIRDNTDLYKVAENIGIPRHKIRFTCMRDKSEYLFRANVLWHLDDDWVEIDSIKLETDVIAIDVTRSNWKQKCNSLLE